MTTEEVIKICKDRNELEFLFQITKSIAVIYITTPIKEKTTN